MLSIRAFARSDAGSVSIWNLFWLVGFCALIGIAVHVFGTMDAKARLQIIAYSPAHNDGVNMTPAPE